MYLINEFIPAGRFSYTKLHDTHTSGRTYIIPPPGGVKAALIAQAFTHYNEETAKRALKAIKTKHITYKLPSYIIVNHQLLWSRKKKEGNFNHSLRNKERVEYGPSGSSLYIAIDIEGLNKKEIELIKTLFSRVTYFGKKESFMQYIKSYTTEQLDEGFLEEYNISNVIEEKRRQEFPLLLHDYTEAINIDILNRFKDNTDAPGDGPYNERRKFKRILYTVKLNKPVENNEDYRFYSIADKQRHI